MKKEIVVHCDTKEKAEALLELWDKQGCKWMLGTSLLGDTCYSVYSSSTCYHKEELKVWYGRKAYYEVENDDDVEYEVISFDQYMKEYNENKIIVTEEVSNILQQAKKKYKDTNNQIYFVLKTIEANYELSQYLRQNDLTFSKIEQAILYGWQPKSKSKFKVGDIVKNTGLNTYFVATEKLVEEHGYSHSDKYILICKKENRVN